MWLYSIRNLKKDFSKVDFEELRETTLKLFQMDYRFGTKAYLHFDLPIARERPLRFDLGNYCCLKDLSRQIAQTTAETQQRSRRSTIDFNDLKQFSDDEDDTKDLDRILPSLDILNRSETQRLVVFDQPIPSYGDEADSQSLKISVHDDHSQNISFTIGGDMTWQLNHSNI